MTDIEKQLEGQVYKAAEEINATLQPGEFEALDVKITAGLDGKLRNVILVLAVGGPYIEADIGKHEVRGYWGDAEARAGFKIEQSEVFFDYYDSLWEATTHA